MPVQPDVRRTIDAVWKLESARIVGGLARIVRDVGLAEELAQDALVDALSQWPAGGIPDNPGAWLTTVARRRAVDHLRRAQRPVLAEVVDQPAEQPADEQDDVLRLMFACCHPALSREARVALTLRLVAGLSAAEIARAFLLDEPRVVRRLAAAKRTLADEGAGFTRPSGEALPARLNSVLEVLYLVFNEGYAATTGQDLIRADLCREALRLGRMLAGLAPGEAEVHGLVALMELQASRAAARTGPSGELILLHEQNRGRWDQLLIKRGFAAMLRARALGTPPGPYVLQAAIAVCHAQARTAADTDWPRIATLYDALVRLLPTPVVRLNRAVAIGMARGPSAGLAEADALLTDPALRDYHLLPAVRGDLLARLNRHAEARREFERAVALTRNAPEQEFLRRRATEMAAAERDMPSGSVPAAVERDMPSGSVLAAAERGAPSGSVPAAAERGAPSGSETAAAERGTPGASRLGVEEPDSSWLVAADQAVAGHPVEPTDLQRVAGVHGAGRGVAVRRGVAGPAVRPVVPGATLGAAVDAFLGRDDLDRATVRSYRQTFTRLSRALGDSLPLAELTAERVATVCATAWGGAAPTTWNRHRSALRSFAAWSRLPDLAAGLDRRPETAAATAPIPAAELAALLDESRHSLRERTLWRMLHESGAPVSAVLGLDVEGLDLDDRRARAGSRWVTWRSGTARLLPDLIAGRLSGPLFLTDRRPAPGATADRCPHTGRARLSYERAEFLFKRAAGAGLTLRRLRVSG